MTSLIDHAAAYVRKCAPASNGSRNNTALSVAGHLAAFTTTTGERLAEFDILQLVRGWNLTNSEPLDDSELTATVHSALTSGTPREDKVVDLDRVKARPTAQAPAKPGDAAPDANLLRPSFKSARELMADNPRLRAPVIHGLLREGETMNCIAPSKARKSWLLNHLALSIVTGRPWLDRFTVEPGPVLIIDNELHAQTSANRIPKVAEALGLRPSDWVDGLCVDNLRGRLADFYGLASYFAAIPHGRFKVIIVDAFYRCLPRDMSENDNGELANIYNRIDTYAADTGAAFILVHHSSKGLQSEKAVTDVGAGAGAQSRAADTHLVLRAHEEDEACVLDAAVRSWPPVEPLAMRWTFPVWSLAPDLDPADLRKSNGRRRKEAEAEAEQPKPEPWTVDRFVENFITGEPVDKKAVRAAAVGAGLGGRQTDDLITSALAVGMAHKWRLPPAREVFLANVKQPDPDGLGDISHARTPPTPPTGMRDIPWGRVSARVCETEPTEGGGQ